MGDGEGRVEAAERPVSEPRFVAETLAWCNGIRSETGREPLASLPKGLRDDPMSCPCGKATGLYVDNETYGTSPEDRWAQPLPEAVTEFVAAFDDGELPQYDERPVFLEEDE